MINTLSRVNSFIIVLFLRHLNLILIQTVSNLRNHGSSLNINGFAFCHQRGNLSDFDHFSASNFTVRRADVGRACLLGATDGTTQNSRNCSRYASLALMIPCFIRTQHRDRYLLSSTTKKWLNIYICKSFGLLIKYNANYRHLKPYITYVKGALSCAHTSESDGELQCIT